MAFTPYSYESGQPSPFAYLKASAGTYSIGLCAALSDGTAAKSVNPDYVIMSDAGTVAAGTVLPAIHITDDVIFEAPLAEASSALKPGSLVDVAADGLSIANTATNKNVQIIDMNGTAAGDLCRCRFVG